MFDLFSQSMLFLLETIKSIVGNYGLAIIVLTLAVRILLWPVSQAQMKSMKMMQTLQPKLKLLQERYKTEPQKLQSEMMKLYQDHKFNPLGGCLPSLVQLPLFLGLYWAIPNLHILANSDPTFLNFIHLQHASVVSHAGPAEDGRMTIAEGGGGGFLGMVGRDAIRIGRSTRGSAGQHLMIELNNGTKLERSVPNIGKALTITPKELQPGVPIHIASSLDALGLSDYKGIIKTIHFNVVNTGTNETEPLTFTPQDNETSFETTLDTVPGKNVVNYDVLLLAAIFAVSMILSQRLMSNQTAMAGSAQQQQVMKLMPIMFSVFLFIFPIPAGVLLYMDTNSLFQLFQTWMFQRGDAANPSKTNPPSQRVLDIKPDSSQA